MLRSASTDFDIRKDKTTFRSCLNQLGSAVWYFVQGTENQEGRKGPHRLRLSSFYPNPLSFGEFRAHGDHKQASVGFFRASRLRKNINFPLISRGNSVSAGLKLLEAVEHVLSVI